MCKMQVLADRLLQLANDEGTAQIHDLAIQIAARCELYKTERLNMEREADIVDDLRAQRDRATLYGDRAPALLIDKHIIGLLWQELLDKDDRTSPADYPEMALITREELADFISRAALSRS